MIRYRLRGLLLALVTALALSVTAGVAAAQEPPPPEGEDPAEQPAEPPAEPPATAAVSWVTIAKLRKQIRRARAKTWHWQRVMGQERSPRGLRERRTRSVERLREARAIWRKRARRAARRARRVPNRGAWLCIHRYEGPWDDPNAPYYGGLQMDLTFQRSYGRYLVRKKGTANRWRPLEQMWTAEKARRSGRGFHPWPNTARRCGLL